LAKGIAGGYGPLVAGLAQLVADDKS